MSSVFVLLLIGEGSDPVFEALILAGFVTFLVHLMTGIIALIVARTLPNRFMSTMGVFLYLLGFTVLGILLFFGLGLFAFLLIWAFWSVGIVINVSLIVLALSVYIRERTNRVSAA